jgi:dolichyl-phosphate beta-glucosyltransferase
MDILWIVLAVVVLVLLAWVLVPYWDWRDVDGKAIEAHIARTSFQCAQGELVPAAWKEPVVSLSVIVPAYNEEYRLPRMLDETLTYLEARAAAAGPNTFSYEVIVVDDGSRDGTYDAAVASEMAAKEQSGRSRGGELRVMQLSQNRGKGFAVRAGMLAARGRLLLMADADGATGIREVERLEQAMDSQGGRCTEIVFGSRHHLKDDALQKRSFIRNTLMVGFHLVVWCLVGGPIHDTQCGFKLFRAGVAKHIFHSLHLYRWAFDIEIVILARILGKPVAEVPVAFVDMPGSKLNLVTGALTMLRDIALLRVLYFTGMWRPTALT